jgi:hypothetical protein
MSNSQYISDMAADMAGSISQKFEDDVLSFPICAIVGCKPHLPTIGGSFREGELWS